MKINKISFKAKVDALTGWTCIHLLVNPALKYVSLVVLFRFAGA